MVRPEYSGMTVNERLFVAGLLHDFEDAIQRHDKVRAMEILASVDVDWPDTVVAQSLNDRHGKQHSAINRSFWPLLLMAAMLVGLWLYHLNSGPDLTCLDGHCPDAGTPEYLAGVAIRHEQAPIVALAGGASVLFIGVMIRALLTWIRRRHA